MTLARATFSQRDRSGDMKPGRHIVVLVVAAMAGPVTSSANADTNLVPSYPGATCCAAERAEAERTLASLRGYLRMQERARGEVDAAETAYLACLERRRLSLAAASPTVPVPVPVDCSFEQRLLRTAWASYWNAAQLVSFASKLWQTADARYRACLARLASMGRCVLTATGGSPVGSGADGTPTITEDAQTAKRDAQGDVLQAKALLADCRVRRMWPTFTDPVTGLTALSISESCVVEVRLLRVAWTVYGTTRRYADAQQVWQAADERYRDCVASGSPRGRARCR